MGLGEKAWRTFRCVRATMAKVSMTVRAWLRWPALVALGAVLVLVALQGVLNADDSPLTWDFEAPDSDGVL